MKKKYSLNFYVCGSYPGLFNLEIWNHPTAELADFYLLISLFPGCSSSHSFTYNSIYKERFFSSTDQHSQRPTTQPSIKPSTCSIIPYGRLKELPIAIALILRMQDLVEKSSPWRIPQTSWLHLLHLIHLIHLNRIVHLFRLINLIHLTHLAGTVDFDHLDPKATFLSNAHPRLSNSSWLSYKEKLKRLFIWKIILQGALKRQGNMTRYIILYEKLHKSNHWTQKVTIFHNNWSISLNVLLNCRQ